jgi:two-component system OmpR family response regulator
MAARILVLDDDLGLRTLVREVLEFAGHTVLAPPHDGNVLAEARAFEPDLCIIDLMLTQTSGFDVADELRQGGFQDTPILAMSASDRLLRLSMQSGLFTAGIGKPFDIDRLLQEVDRLLGGLALRYGRSVTA